MFSLIQKSINFGTLRSRKNIFSFTLKCLFYIISAIILGNYTDITIKNIKKNKGLDDYTIYYILLQTIIIISTFYLILIFLNNYTSEFQVTIAGGLFSVFYFGIQTNYVYMIKEYTQY